MVASAKEVQVKTAKKPVVSEVDVVRLRREMTIPLPEVCMILRALAQSQANSVAPKFWFLRRVEELDACQGEKLDPKVFAVGGARKNEVFYREMLKLLNVPRDFADACREFPRIFSPFVCAMLKTADQAPAQLPAIYRRTADFLADINKTRNELIRMLMYPATVIVLSIVLVLVICLNLVPVMRDAYAALLKPGERFNWYSEAVLSILGFVGDYWYLVGVLVGAAGILYWKARQGVAVRKAEERVLLSIVGLWRYFALVDLANFFFALNILWDTGMGMPQVLQLAGEVFQLMELRDAARLAVDDVANGRPASIADAMSKYTPFFHKLSAPYKAIKHREETADQFFLERFHEEMREEARQLQGKIMAWVEPVAIIVIGVVVGAILIAMYLPLFELPARMAHP
ncbi:MAG: type II secretion system F family protein [Blastocatellia bacterium]|nr:type II secretion system F family protein [Blastocatellia bacterium]